MHHLILGILLLTSICLPQNRLLTISGKIVNKATGLPLPNCNILVVESNRGTVSDTSGYFIIYLSEGKYHLQFSHMGFKTKLQEFYFSLKRNINNLLIEMETSSIEEELVTIFGDLEKSNLERQKFDKLDIVNMPNLYSDALRSIQILPGVTSNNELSSSYNVRGGNFDENLVYLNGFQIYRPFLLKQGIEENQTLINPGFLKDMQFYSNGFPSKFGDKMSSALNISYQNEFQDSIHGNLKADLMNLSISANKRLDKINLIAGIRLAYPSMFLNTLHTTGSYKPKFSDIQALANYNVREGSNLELLFILSNNRFDFSPYEFESNFQSYDAFGGSIRGLKINFNGDNNYTFKTMLLGLKYTGKITENINVLLAASSYNTAEDEKTNTSSDFYYIPDARTENKSYVYLKSRIQRADNSMEMTARELKSSVSLSASNHKLEFGTSLSRANITNRLDEKTYDSGLVTIHEDSLSRYIASDMGFITFSAYLQDDYRLGDILRIAAGIRYLHYDFTGENMISPRAALFVYPSSTHNFNLSWGYYFQPPFYYEFRNKNNPQDYPIKSQKAIFFSAGWDYKFKEKVKFQLQAYYKSLKNLIPYYVEQLKLEYMGKNNMEGYAFGFDLQFQGEITSNVQSWLGYSYLDTKERFTGTNEEYQRRFLDQKHTIQIFLQDKFPKHPNWQSHLRLIFGSGFLYPVRRAISDPILKTTTIEVLLKERRVFPFYMRADMGLTANFHISGSYRIRILAEVLNVFNKQNIANYIWAQTYKEVKQAIWIPQMYSERFFNLGMELSF